MSPRPLVRFLKTDIEHPSLVVLVYTSPQRRFFFFTLRHPVNFVLITSPQKVLSFLKIDLIAKYRNDMKYKV